MHKIEVFDCSMQLEVACLQYYRKSREKKNTFLETGVVAATAEAGTAIGAAATGDGGSLCTGLGEIVGGALGALLGLVTPTAVKYFINICTGMARVRKYGKVLTESAFCDFMTYIVAFVHSLLIALMLKMS